MDAGAADTLLVSVDTFGIDSAEEQPPCMEPRPYEVICEHPQPFTTGGEAAWVADHTAAHGWDRIAVVTSTPHVARTRYLFDQCVPAEILIIDDRQDVDLVEWATQFVYQTAAFVKSFVAPDC